MKKDNIDYITIDIIKETIEELLDTKYNNIRNYINNISIKVTNEDVLEFLSNRRKEENEDPSNHYLYYKKKKSSSFNPFAFHYYNKSINMLKKKIYKLLDIIDNIENIFNNKISDDKQIDIIKLLLELDITIDQDDNLVKREDAIRIITPIMENIDKLKLIEKNANDIETYIGFRLTDRFTSEYDTSENEIYPDERLQIKDLIYISINSEYGYVPLSEKQKKLIKEKNKFF